MVLMETSSSSATEAAVSGLRQEVWLSARRRRSFVVIPLASARVSRVWAGRRDSHISRRRSVVWELPWTLGGKQAIRPEVRAMPYWHADLLVVADKVEGFLQLGWWGRG